MKKYFLTSLFFVVVSLQGFSQWPDNREEITKIDSLENLLHTLKGTSRINCMIKIAEHILDTRAIGRFLHRNDSIQYYGALVLNESGKLNYKRGTAFGLLITAINAVDSVREKNILETIRIGKEINDDEVLGWGYVDSIEFLKDRHPKFDEVVACYKKAIFHFHKAGNVYREMENTIWLSDMQVDRGEYEAAFDDVKKGARLLRTVSPEFPMSYENLRYNSTLDLYRIYRAAGDYEAAINCFRADTAYFKTQSSFNLDGDFASFYCDNKQYDSAMIYWKRYEKAEDFYVNPPFSIGFPLLELGAIHLGAQQYDSAIEVFHRVYDLFKPLYKNINTGGYWGAPGYGIMSASLSLGKAYNEKRQYESALRYAKEGTAIAELRVLRPEVMDGYEVLSSTYHHLGNNDSAYKYLLAYTALKDSIENRKLLLRVYTEKKNAEDDKKQSQILLLNKDNKLKDAQLKQESLVRNFLIGGLIILFIAGIFIFRTVTLRRKTEKLQREQLENNFKVQQLENEKRQAELQQQAAELEMQALRAQMNPHFIFNCLSAINRIILKNDSKTASDYLTRFSRLIRMVLINSQKSMIPLEDELDMLRLYLDMERLRFKNSFDYSIIFTNTIDAGAIFIPPLLLQPFCENAVWHGLMQKEGQGHLNVELSKQDNILYCAIADDGIGRKKAAELKSKSAERGKSLGLEITALRLALLNQDKQVQTFYTIDDIKDAEDNIAGTKVILKICYKELMEESV